jgi:hypothetical protein
VSPGSNCAEICCNGICQLGQTELTGWAAHAHNAHPVGHSHGALKVGSVQPHLFDY